jgi:hypothetical protein
MVSINTGDGIAGAQCIPLALRSLPGAGSVEPYLPALTLLPKAEGWARETIL